MDERLESGVVGSGGVFLSGLVWVGRASIKDYLGMGFYLFSYTVEVCFMALWLIPYAFYCFLGAMGGY